MKIAIIGSHSTGKTTICKKLVEKLNPDHFFITEMARVFGIEKMSPKYRTLITQKKMFITQSMIEGCHDNFISDRSILDFGIYSRNSMFILLMLHNMKNRYDIIFYVPIRFNIEDDGFRNTDAQYQKLIAKSFERWIPEIPCKVHEIKEIGIQDRIKEICREIEKINPEIIKKF